MAHEEPPTSSSSLDATSAAQDAATPGPISAAPKAPRRTSFMLGGHSGSLRRQRIRWAAWTITAFVLPMAVDLIRSAITGQERMPELALVVGQSLATAILVVWILLEIARWAGRVFHRAPGATRTFRDPQTVRRLLAEHDLPCPRCAYNLRGVERDRCPECGEQLVIGLGAIDPWQRMLPLLIGVGWVMVVGGTLRAMSLGRSIGTGLPQGPGPGVVQPTWLGGWTAQPVWLFDFLLSLLPVAILLPLLVRVMVAGPETSNRRAYRLMQGLLLLLAILVLGAWARDRLLP